MQRINPNKKERNHEQEAQVFCPAPYYSRYLSYILDLLFIFGLTSLIFSVLGNKPLAFEIVSNYSDNVKPLLNNQELRSFYWMVGLYIFIAFIYFYREAVSGTSTAKYLSGIMTVKIVPKNSLNQDFRRNFAIAGVVRIIKEF